jgi:hypothetical protein
MTYLEKELAVASIQNFTIDEGFIKHMREVGIDGQGSTYISLGAGVRFRA